jgi:hypothetical protein
MKNKPACILYSGGADSTLAAALMLREHSPVHLLSFKHCRMSQLDKTTHAVQRFREHFGKDAVVHHWVDMTSLWRKISREPPHVSPGCGCHPLFAFLLKPCLACKVAMHQLTLAYCIRWEIPVVADGAHPGGASLFPEQLNEGIRVLQAFYRRYHIDYKNPVYGVDRPDFEIFKQGITGKKNTKDEHLYYSNQFACHVGLLAYIYHYLTRPFDRNKTKTTRLSVDFLERCLRKEKVSETLNQKVEEDE